MLNFVRRYLKRLMRYFNFEKWSELRSSRSFQKAYNFLVISWKNIFCILLNKLAKRQFYSSRLQQLKNYLCMIFRSGDIGRRQRIKKTHYVIQNNWLLLGILYVKFHSSISQNVDEIFQFWKVIWTRLIKELPKAYNFSWYLEKILFWFNWKK